MTSFFLETTTSIIFLLAIHTFFVIKFAKLSLLAGVVPGSRLAVITEAPKPAGYKILKVTFHNENISPLDILKSAILPTIISLLCFVILPFI